MSLVACWTAVQGFHGTRYEPLNHKNRKTTQCCSKTQKTHSSLHNRDSHGGDHSKLLKCTGCTASQQVLLQVCHGSSKRIKSFRVVVFFSFEQNLHSIQTLFCLSFFSKSFKTFYIHPKSSPQSSLCRDLVIIRYELIGDS